MLVVFAELSTLRRSLQKAEEGLAQEKTEKLNAENLVEAALAAAERVQPELRRTQADLREAQLAHSAYKERKEREMERKDEEFKKELKSKTDEVKHLHTHLQGLKKKVG